MAPRGNKKTRGVARHPGHAMNWLWARPAATAIVGVNSNDFVPPPLAMDLSLIPESVAKGQRMNVVVTGGAGFIGSNLVDRLVEAGHKVTIIDNLSGGRRAFIEHHVRRREADFIKLDIRRHDQLVKALPKNTECVFHLAANADIARGVHDPTLDFEQTTVGTFSLLRAMQARGIKQIVYTSGSGVYGDRGLAFSSESHGPLTPVSMYGATKLSAEGLISAFCHLYDWRAWILGAADIN